MTRDNPTDALIALLRCVPVHAIDPQAAEARGDHAAIGYARAMAAWRREAALALAQAEDSRLPDAFSRVATATALMRQPAAE